MAERLSAKQVLQVAEEANALRRGGQRLVQQAMDTAVSQALARLRAEALSGLVSVAENRALRTRYGDYLEQTINAVQLLNDERRTLRGIAPRQRLMEGASGRGWRARSQDLLRSAARAVDVALGETPLATLGKDELAALSRVALDDMIAQQRAVQGIVDRIARANRSGPKAPPRAPVQRFHHDSDGTWLGLYDGARSDTPLAVVFIPMQAGASAPTRIPRAIAGALASPAPSGLTPILHAPDVDPQTLRTASSALVQKMQDSAIALEKGTATANRYGPQPAYGGIPLARQDALGTAIQRAERVALSPIDLEDIDATECWLLRGHAGETLDSRLDEGPVAAIDKALTQADKDALAQRFGEGFTTPFQWLHAWGRVLGDSTRIGGAYGPALANAVQLRIEFALKGSGKALTLRSYTRTELLSFGPVRVFRGASYEFPHDGAMQRIGLTMNAQGYPVVSISNAVGGKPAVTTITSVDDLVLQPWDVSLP